MYNRFIDKLSERASIFRASNAGATIRFLSTNTPTVIPVTDPVLLENKNADALDRVLLYAHEGGTVIVGCLFSTFVRPQEMTKLFQDKLDIPWQRGDYHRTKVHLNKGIDQIVQTHLVDSYSQKVVFLRNVDSKDALYRPSSDSIS